MNREEYTFKEIQTILEANKYNAINSKTLYNKEDLNHLITDPNYVEHFSFGSYTIAELYKRIPFKQRFLGFVETKLKGIKQEEVLNKNKEDKPYEILDNKNSTHIQNVPYYVSQIDLKEPVTKYKCKSIPYKCGSAKAKEIPLNYVCVLYKKDSIAYGLFITYLFPEKIDTPLLWVNSLDDLKTKKTKYNVLRQCCKCTRFKQLNDNQMDEFLNDLKNMSLNNILVTEVEQKWGIPRRYFFDIGMNWYELTQHKCKYVTEKAKEQRN